MRQTVSLTATAIEGTFLTNIKHFVHDIKLKRESLKKKSLQINSCYILHKLQHGVGPKTYKKKGNKKWMFLVSRSRRRSLLVVPFEMVSLVEYTPSARNYLQYRRQSPNREISSSGDNFVSDSGDCLFIIKISIKP